MRAAAAAALLLCALILPLAGCESSQEENAEIARSFKAKRLSNQPLDGLSVARRSTEVTVTSSELLRSSEGDAAVVEVRNGSAESLRNVPIELEVRSAGGTTLYTNATPGLARSLVSIALLGAHTSQTWIDDQVQLTGTPARLSVRIGEAEAVNGAIPRLSITGHVFQTPSSGVSFEGSVGNGTSTPQHEVVVDCIGRRDGKIVAAGRAVLTLLAPHESAHFQAFFVGDPQGAELLATAPATSAN